MKLQKPTSKRIARYFSLEGVVAFLQTRKVHFTRLDKFSDINEGLQNSNLAIHKAQSFINSINAGYGHIPARYVDRIIERSKTDVGYREKVFASCWTTAPHESVAQWNLYTERAKGILFYMDLDALVRSFGDTPLQSQSVTYRDFDVDLAHTPEQEVIFSKTKHYAFEQEFRFVIDSNKSEIPSKFERTERGLLVPSAMDLNNSAIVIGFGFDSWTLKSVKDLLVTTGYPTNQIHLSEINWTRTRHESLR